MGPSRFESVDERARRTGFVSGPSNKSVPGMDQPPQAAPAPNYRNGEDGNQCRDCVHYGFEERRCAKYDFDAKPLMTCDSFEAAGAEGADAMMAPGDGGGSMMAEEYE
jgi:hypothetical protein